MRWYMKGLAIHILMSLRASYPSGVKTATLIHELCHRLLTGNGIGRALLVGTHSSVQIAVHKQLNLVLYDIWFTLYGEDFARRSVITESERSPLYKKAWEWTLRFDKRSREERFEGLVGEMKSPVKETLSGIK